MYKLFGMMLYMEVIRKMNKKKVLERIRKAIVTNEYWFRSDFF